MLRSAEACGVHGVLFPTRRAAPLTAAAIKASAGAVEHLLLVPLDDLAGGLVDLRTRGLRLVGADESASLAYRDADLRGPLALVVGSEGHGISGPIRRRIDLAVRIPMRGRVGSLNAAVAGSVLLFEAAAQRPAPRSAVEPAPAGLLSPADASPDDAGLARWPSWPAARTSGEDAPRAATVARRGATSRSGRRPRAEPRSPSRPPPPKPARKPRAKPTAAAAEMPQNDGAADPRMTCCPAE